MFRSFHHPDVSLPVIRRQLAAELIELVFWVGRLTATQGRSFTWSDWPVAEQHACCCAAHRLRQSGLLAWEPRRGKPPRLELTPRGEELLPDEVRPERRWRSRWNKLWYVLVYDVPEDERTYRGHLRGFLRRKRLGCLQRSVYVTPFDIRPDYADLTLAAGIGQYAVLFEARTVLGQSPVEIVQHAWDCDRLEQAQTHYLSVCADNLADLRRHRPAPKDLLALARTECAAYRAVMSLDPLLPAALHPPGYRGGETVDLHREFGDEVARALSHRE